MQTLDDEELRLSNLKDRVCHLRQNICLSCDKDKSYKQLVVLSESLKDLFEDFQHKVQHSSEDGDEVLDDPIGFWRANAGQRTRLCFRVVKLKLSYIEEMLRRDLGKPYRYDLGPHADHPRVQDEKNASKILSCLVNLVFQVWQSVSMDPGTRASLSMNP